MSWRTRSSTPDSPPTITTPSVARCHRSWLSTSAIEALNRERTRSFTRLTTDRFAFRESEAGRCSSRRKVPTRISGEPARDFLEDIGFDDVLLLDVVAVLERDPALVSARHLADVVFEPAGGRDLAFPDRLSFADQAGAGASLHGSRLDHAARDDAGLGRAEDLPHFGGADDR